MDLKSHRGFLDKGVLNRMMFSYLVEYLDGGIHCEGGTSPFSKIGILFIALLHNAQVACSCHILVCVKTCCTIAAYQYTCTYNILYSLSCVREQCDDGL